MNEFEKLWEVWYQERRSGKYGESYPEVVFEQWAENQNEFGIKSFISSTLTKIVLEFFGIDYYMPFDDIYYGICPTKMSEDETMGEFKLRISKAMKKLFGEDEESDWHEYAWRDG